VKAHRVGEMEKEAVKVLFMYPQNESEIQLFQETVVCGLRMCD
jgi:hypothetical protein